MIFLSISSSGFLLFSVGNRIIADIFLVELSFFRDYVFFFKHFCSGLLLFFCGNHNISCGTVVL